MKAKLKNRLSVKVVLLTLVMASMTLISSLVGITSLSEFGKEYEQVKNEKFNLLLKMTELKIKTDAVIHLSTEMLLSETLDELQSNISEVADKQLWIDRLFYQLPEDINDRQQLLLLKSRLYSHLDGISDAVSDRFIFSERFLKPYRIIEEYKKESLQSGDVQFFIILDTALSHFNPVINKQLTLNEYIDIKNLESYIVNISTQLDDEKKQRLQTLFLGEDSLSINYQSYAQKIHDIKLLRFKNKEFTDIFMSLINKNVSYIQSHFRSKLSTLEWQLNKRKEQLYMVIFSCLLATIFLLFLQLSFIRRIELIRKMISAGESDHKLNFPINGKDEISKMALSVKSYIDRLVIKEQQVLESNKQLEHLASHDGLTNIYNRRYFESFLLQENSRYLRYKDIYCIAMIDLDFFKQVNDKYGHDAGDHILIEFAKRVLAIIRKIDVFARFGGEEFVLLMPNTTEAAAFALMERIRVAIKESPYVYNDKAIQFTVSIGLLEVKGALADEPLKQISYADKALYEAKETGRNRTCTYRN